MRKHLIALLIPAHNEELVIEHTIKSAKKAGFSYRDVYVVNDGSNDKTAEIATNYLKSNVLTNDEGIGKGEALKRGMKEFHLFENYTWVTITDADTIFNPDFKKQLRISIKKNRKHKDLMAIAGQVKTMKARWISHYRAFEYGFGQDLYKRVEGYLNLVLILPGCASCFNTKYLAMIDETGFKNNTLVEDYDMTLEMHEKFKGKIVYEPKMIVWTQEPLNLKVYLKQINRWYRGWYQVAKKRLSFPPKKTDLLILYFTLDSLIFTAELAALISLSVIKRNANVLSYLFLADIVTMVILCSYTSISKKRPEIIAIFPLIYFLRLLNVFIFLKSGFEVLVLRKFPLKRTSWENSRYAIQSS